MTALDQLRSLIDRELGTSGWEYQPYDYYPYAPGKLRTQRGDIPFSTMKLLVELIPELLREAESPCQQALDDAYDQGYEEGKHVGWMNRDDD